MTHASLELRHEANRTVALILVPDESARSQCRPLCFRQSSARLGLIGHALARVTVQRLLATQWLPLLRLRPHRRTAPACIVP